MVEPDKNPMPLEPPKTEVDNILKEMLGKKEEKPPLENLKTILSEVDLAAKGEKTVVGGSSVALPAKPQESSPHKSAVNPVLNSPAVARLEKIISDFRAKKV